MQFRLSEEHELLRSSTRELLEGSAPLGDTREVMEKSTEGYSKRLFAQLAQLGYAGLLLPSSKGGMGSIAFACVLEEMGRVAMPGPFLDVVLTVRLLEACGGELAATWLSHANGGDKLVVVAWQQAGMRTARFHDDRLTGFATFVPFGANADAIVVEAAEGLVLVERPRQGWDAQSLPTLDPAQRFAKVNFDGPAKQIADREEMRLLRRKLEPLAALGASAMLLGGADRILELTTTYLAERSAFGVPIGSFQALQHRCADMLLRTESMRSAVYRAAWRMEQEVPEAAYLAAVAKAFAGPAARFVCDQGIQLHGGVGFTWEYDLHIYLKRTKTLEQFYGSTRDQIEFALAARDSAARSGVHSSHLASTS